MKRSAIFVTITVVTGFTFGLLRAKENGMLKAFPSLQARRSEMVNAIAKEEAQQTLLRQTIASQKARRLLVSQEPPFSTPLTAWLLAGDFSNVPRSLVPELRSALALPPKLSSDF